MNILETLNDREAKYGDFAQLAEVIQMLKSLARNAPAWHAMTPVMREATDMDIVKTARLLYGEPFLRDSWLDKAGYAQLVVEDLDKAEAQKAKLPSGPPKMPHPVDLDELAGGTQLPSNRMAGQ